MELKNGYSPETTLSKERLLARAEKIAEFLTGKGDVEKVGIAGSLAREKEKPTDIDIVLFVNKDCAKRYYLGQASEALNHDFEKKHTPPNLDRKKHTIQKIGLKEEQLLELFFMLFNERFRDDSSQPNVYPVDWIIVPSDPSDSFIKLSTFINFDPDYLRQLSKDVLTYNPTTKQFEKESYLDDRQKMVLHNATTEALKNLVNNEEYAEAVRKSLGHQKRVQRAMAKQI